VKTLYDGAFMMNPTFVPCDCGPITEISGIIIDVMF